MLRLEGLFSSTLKGRERYYRTSSRAYSNRLISRYGRLSDRYIESEIEHWVLKASDRGDAVDFDSTREVLAGRIPKGIAISPQQYRRVVSRLVSSNYIIPDSRSPEQVLSSIEDVYGGEIIDVDRNRKNVPVRDLTKALRTYLDVANERSTSDLELNQAIDGAFKFLGRDRLEDPEYSLETRQTVKSGPRRDKVIYLDSLISNIHDEYMRSSRKVGEGVKTEVIRFLKRMGEDPR